jgi:hypothetical protein
MQVEIFAKNFKPIPNKMSFERETISIIKSILRMYCSLRFNIIFCGAQVDFMNVRIAFYRICHCVNYSLSSKTSFNNNLKLLSNNYYHLIQTLCKIIFIYVVLVIEFNYYYAKCLNQMIIIV